MKPSRFESSDKMNSLLKRFAVSDSQTLKLFHLRAEIIADFLSSALLLLHPSLRPCRKLCTSFSSPC